MTENVLSIDRIKTEAAKAAQVYDCVNDACPYSFYSEAGRVFKTEFQRARMAMNFQNKSTTQGVQP
jgi:hypothetical protein